MTAKPILFPPALNSRITKRRSRGARTKMLSLKNRSSLVVALVGFIFQAVSLQATINVVSYWRLGESDPGAAAGVTATNTTDSVGAKNLKFQGNAKYTNDVAASAVTQTGSSLSVNFTNSAYATNAIVSTATNNFGIECWVKPTALGGGQVIAYNGGTGGVGSGGWGIIIGADNTYDGLFGGVIAFGTNVATANVWTHVALVRASGISTLYINGAAAATSTVAPALPQGNFALGAPPQSPTSQFFTGLIDEARVFTFTSGQFSTSDLLLGQPTPVVITTGPTSVATNTATLNGTVNPYGLPTSAWFQWGLIQFPYGSTTAVTNPGSGNVPRPVRQVLSGLTPGLTYHYRLVASNTLGTVRGQDLQFWAPRQTMNGNNPVVLKHQAWIDPGATVHAAPSAVALGYSHTLALKADGTVVAWGDNAYGQTNIPASATNVVAIAARDFYSLALKADGTVVGWGDNTYGQTNIPASATNVVAIAAGGAFGLALRADGTIVGWGNSSGTNIPASATNIIAISAGEYNSLALRADGTIAGWGSDFYGQISLLTNSLLRATNVVAIAVSDDHSLALRADGTVVGWGDNTYGQINIPALGVVVAIAAGGSSSFGLRADGTIAGWGSDLYGQISLQTNSFVNGTNALAIAAGGSYSLALKTDGTIVGAGYGPPSQLNIPAGLDMVSLPGVSTDNVNTNVLGSYQVNYFVTNAYATFAVSRSVLVIDSPTIISNPSASLLATNTADGHRIVRFSASVNPNGSPTIVSIAYGMTAGYGAVSSTNILPGLFTPQTVTVDVPLSPGFTFHWRVAATNGVGTIPGSAVSPDQVFTVPAAFLLGDANGDGIVDQSELSTVYSNYLPTSPWLLMTNVVGLGDTNVSFALSNSISGGYSVEVSTNLADWQFLGPATPRYVFTDTNSPAAPQRYYRLRYP